MQSENFDNKIKQAADQHHPNYDEKAWSKMEKLLDKHLPEKKDRRRIIFLLFLFLLLGGGAWFFISKPWQPTDKTLNQETVQQKPGTDPDKQSTKEPGESTSLENKQPDKPVTGVDNTNKNNPGVTNDNTNSSVTPAITTDRSVTGKEIAGGSQPSTPVISKKNRASAGNIKKQDELGVDVTNPAIDKKIAEENNTPSEKITGSTPNDKKDDDVSVKSNDEKKMTTNQPENKTVITQDKSNDKKETVTNEEKKTDDQQAAGKSATKTNKSKKKNTLFFSLSAGPDVSYIGLDNPGKLKLLAGAGIGYVINNKLTIRTGFYTASKIYTAGKNDYKPAVAPPPNYLERIEANCRIYEIPLSLAYNFGKSEKQNTFLSAGLSSFIMKKETYDYVYQYPGAPAPSIYTHKENNGNKHYFSVLALSGGYQRKISKVVSLSAEPYIKLPLGGVGYGKVKLKSAGILFSANIKPFK